MNTQYMRNAIQLLRECAKDDDPEVRQTILGVMQLLKGLIIKEEHENSQTNGTANPGAIQEPVSAPINPGQIAESGSL